MRKGFTLPTETIVIMVVIVVLIFIVFVFSGKAKDSLWSSIKNLGGVIRGL